MDLLDRLRLDVPVAQAGMGGGLAGPELAAAVAAAGGLGTSGWLPPDELREAIHQVRDAAPDRSVAVNLLMPFVRRSHVDSCVEIGNRCGRHRFRDGSGAARNGSPSTACSFRHGRHRTSRHAEAIASAPTASSRRGAKRADTWRAATATRWTFLRRRGRTAATAPILLAGGIATGHTLAALAAGADGVVAGTGFC